MYLIQNATILNEGQSFKGSVLTEGTRIKKIFRAPGPLPRDLTEDPRCTVVEAEGMYLLPGIIDEHVHFRQPGETQKGCIRSESRAALLGGVTSFLDMPNNRPPVIDRKTLEDKRGLAAAHARSNYGFYLGATNANLSAIQQVRPDAYCGIKVFMGSSTGNLMVDNAESLDALFSGVRRILACHCEEEHIIQRNRAEAMERYGDSATARIHPYVRSREACIQSTKKALALARRHKAHVHILHVSTAEEVALIAGAQKTNPFISAEACMPHLWFADGDYSSLNNLIKCNPSVKTASDREALRQGVREGVLQTVATDHAPHTLHEKLQNYWQAPSGIPLVQHSLLMMWELVSKGVFSPTQVVKAMCHNPARLFGIRERGFIREGFFADMVILDPAGSLTVTDDNLACRCGWSPLKGHRFQAAISLCFLNGKLCVKDGEIQDESSAMPLAYRDD